MIKIAKPQLSSVKNYLEDKKRQIERRLLSLRQEDPFADSDRLADNAASDTESREEEGHERIEVLQSELQAQLTRVKSALARIGIGKYGLCQKCGKPIESDRLKVFPMAEYCLADEKKIEGK